MVVFCVWLSIVQILSIKKAPSFEIYITVKLQSVPGIFNLLIIYNCPLIYKSNVIYVNASSDLIKRMIIVYDFTMQYDRS